jgi:hypothetical protein
MEANLKKRVLYSSLAVILFLTAVLGFFYFNRNLYSSLTNGETTPLVQEVPESSATTEESGSATVPPNTSEPVEQKIDDSLEEGGKSGDDRDGDGVAGNTENSKCSSFFDRPEREIDKYSGYPVLASYYYICQSVKYSKDYCFNLKHPDNLVLSSYESCVSNASDWKTLFSFLRTGKCDGLAGRFLTDCQALADPALLLVTK